LLNTALPRDLAQYVIDVGIDLSIDETDHTDAVLCELLGAASIVRPLRQLGATVTIDLDRQLALMAEKIEDEAKDRMLSPEFDATQLFAT